MRYIKFTGRAPYCGTEFTDYEAYPDSVSNDELDEEAADMARNNGESFEYIETGWNNDAYEDEEERERALQNYYDGCWCEWEEISEEEYLNRDE